MSDHSSSKIPYKKLPPDEQWFYEKITLGLPSALRKVSGVHKVEIQRRPGCEDSDIDIWEEGNGISLPEDLRNFYKSTDGFNLTWGYNMNKSVVPIGKLAINKLIDLKPLYHDNMLALSPLVPHEHPRFDRLTDKIFVIEFTRDASYVCLVYMGHKNDFSIWLLDRSFEWHFLSTTFTKYFRVMLVHQGLPQWQLMMTPMGMAPWAEQLAYSMARHVVCKKDKKMKRGEPSKVAPEIQALVVAEEELRDFDDGSTEGVSEGSTSYDEGEEEEEEQEQDEEDVTTTYDDYSSMPVMTEKERADEEADDTCEDNDSEYEEVSTFNKVSENPPRTDENNDESKEIFSLDDTKKSKGEFMKILRCISNMAKSRRDPCAEFYGDDEYYD